MRPRKYKDPPWIPGLLDPDFDDYIEAEIRAMYRDPEILQEQEGEEENDYLSQ